MSHEYHEPPDLRGKEIDFSQAHFLDHTIWECGRGEFQWGGRRQHFALMWEYKWGETVRQHTKCVLGFHRKVTMWTNDQPGGTPAWVQIICRDCGAKLSNRQPV